MPDKAALSDPIVITEDNVKSGQKRKRLVENIFYQDDSSTAVNIMRAPDQIYDEGRVPEDPNLVDLNTNSIKQNRAENNNTDTCDPCENNSSQSTIFVHKEKGITLKDMIKLKCPKNAVVNVEKLNTNDYASEVPTCNVAIDVEEVQEVQEIVIDHEEPAIPEIDYIKTKKQSSG